ncbi:hypothetical protein MMC07_002449 [Pseudocyphellaria aurata]|nr:hypothetical protein [Pseudocyphellaria aurata]
MLKVIFLFLIALAIAAPAPQPDEHLKVTLLDRHLFVRASEDVDGLTFLRNLNDTLKKYYSKTFVPPLTLNDTLKTSFTDEGLQKRLSKEALVDQYVAPTDRLYYSAITVGSIGPQKFRVNFDTGFLDLFLPGPKCNANAGCPHPTKYDQGGIDQHRKTSVSYGSGQISGKDYLDDVTVAGLTFSHADGLCGMAFSEIANSGFTTYFENLIAQKKVVVQEFAFYLGRMASGTGQKSKLTLGGRNKSKFYGTVTQVPVTRRGYWQVALESVNVNGKSTGAATKGQAAIDTGTTLILAPKATVSDIHRNIPGAFLVSLGTLTLIAYPCDTKASDIPALQFVDKSFSIASSDFNFGQLTAAFAKLIGSDQLLSYSSSRSSSMCLGAIVGTNLDLSQNLYVVGDTFLKNWYSIYNYVNAGGHPSVSFAKSVG